jgi:hypothetical protein
VFITGNPLGPTPRDLIVPWARSNQPGYLVGGNKFDLDRWDPEYFARLKDFLSKAEERGIVVEICFFNSGHQRAGKTVRAIYSPQQREERLVHSGSWIVPGRPEPESAHRQLSGRVGESGERFDRFQREVRP